MFCVFQLTFGIGEGFVILITAGRLK